MALPHLKVDGKQNSNFKNPYEADFVTRSRTQERNVAAQKCFIEKQSRYQNFNSTYENLISDDLYEKSLKSFIALKEKARKDKELIYRRERLSRLLRSEQQMFLNELKAANTPRCKVLYDEIRQKGFFEKLYEDEGSVVSKPRVPAHLISEYEQELYGESEDAVKVFESRMEQKAKLRNFLLFQQQEKRAKLEEDRRLALMEDLENMKNLRLLDDEEILYREKQRWIQERNARDNSCIASSARRRRVALEVANNAAVEEEAMRSDARDIARRALVEARRQELHEETQKRLAEQVRDKHEKLKSESQTKINEKHQMEELQRYLAADKEATIQERFKMLQHTRDTYANQMHQKKELTKAEEEAHRQEMERERIAEQAYQALMNEEAAKIRARNYSNYRYQTSKSTQ